ncbi:MAG: hypothetical protein HY888_14480 [Deltaproteobacteria bacterium]|nr:hypothetical protein [Deltaproteobacteria bacterium]
MTIFRITLLSLLTSLALMLVGCAGSGVSSRVAETTPQALPQSPAKVILKLAVTDIPDGTGVGAIQVSLQLPAGVTPNSYSGNDASASVLASGSASGALAASPYNSATGILTPAVVSATGFKAGEFLTISCKVAPGTIITTASFPAYARIVQIYDSKPAPARITGASCPVTVILQ